MCPVFLKGLYGVVNTGITLTGLAPPCMRNLHHHFTELSGVGTARRRMAKDNATAWERASPLRHVLVELPFSADMEQICGSDACLPFPDSVVVAG